MNVQSAPPFNVKRYGEVRLKTNSDSNSIATTQGEDCQEDYVIRETQNAYNAVFEPENWVLKGENAIDWNDSPLATNL